MGDKKHYVFSARTTEEGLGILNGIRDANKIGWDELILAAVNAHYGVEVPMPPKAPVDEAKAEAKAARETEKTEKAEARTKAAAEKKATAEAKAKAAKVDKVKAAKVKADKAKADKAKADKAKAKKATVTHGGHDEQGRAVVIEETQAKTDEPKQE